MALPIDPLTITAAAHVAGGALQVLQSGVSESTAAFRDLLLGGVQETDGHERHEQLAAASSKLQTLHQQLVGALRDADVDLSFRIAITNDHRRGLTVDGIHIDQERIANALQSRPDLQNLFQELEEVMRELDGANGSLRLEFRDDEIVYDWLS